MKTSQISINRSDKAVMEFSHGTEPADDIAVLVIELHQKREHK